MLDGAIAKSAIMSDRL